MRHAFFQFAPPRHPLARAGLALAGLAILGLLSALGLAFAVLVVGALAFRATVRRLSPAGARARTSTLRVPGVIEGEYRVVGRSDSQPLPTR